MFEDESDAVVRSAAAFARVAPGERILPSWLAPRLVSAPAREEELAGDLESESLAARMDAAPAVVPRELLTQAVSEYPMPPSSQLRIPSVPRLSEEPPLALQQENDALRRTLAATLDALARTRREVTMASEPEMVKLACAVAERIVGQELRADPSLVLGWIREATASMAARERVTVACGVDFAAALPPDGFDGEVCTVIVDPSMPTDACEVRTETTTTSVGAAARIAAIVSHVEGRS